MAFNYSKLRGRIIEKFGSQGAFAEALGKKEQTVSAKLNNRIGLTKEDILEWSELLGIENAEYGAYFFTQDV